MTRTIIDLLTARVRADGSRPLLTWYRPAGGERTEFSAASFANWVDKTANLLDTLGVDGLVAGPVSVTDPLHWMSLVWPLAAWQRGLPWAAVRPPLPPEAQLAVVGPLRPEALIPGATLACSLHPLGLGLRDLPPGVLDYTSEALAEPDAHAAVPAVPQSPAWLDDTIEISHEQLVGLAPEAGRVLVRTRQAWPALREAVCRPLLGGGSAVVVVGEVSEDELARIIASERVSREALPQPGPGSRTGTGRTS